MNQKLQKWLAALRSGKYQQARNQLRTDMGFCCLGVACDVVAPDAWHKEDRLYWEHFGKSLGPSDTVMGKFKISDSFASNLACLNDDVGFNFEQIADYIEGKARLGVAFKNYNKRTGEEIPNEY